jgi:hypothetical protein
MATQGNIPWRGNGRSSHRMYLLDIRYRLICVCRQAAAWCELRRRWKDMMMMIRGSSVSKVAYGTGRPRFDSQRKGYFSIRYHVQTECEVLSSEYWELLDYGLDDRASIHDRSREGIFSLRRRVQTCSGAHPAFCPMGTWCSFPRGKAVGA